MTEKFGPDDAAERERQAYNAEPAPPLVDTTDPGHAERLAKLRDRAEAIIKADPVPTFGKAREEIATTIDGTLMTTAKADDSRCDAIAPNSTARCCYRADHPPLIVQGAQYDHHVPGVVSWNVPYIEAPAPVPQREPGAALNCTSVSAHGDMCTLTRDHDGMHERHEFGERKASWETTYDAPRCESRATGGWVTPDSNQCTLVAGHKGYHRGEEGVSWGVGAPSVADSVNDASSWIGKVFGGLGGPALKLTALNSQPVRVRFVDLPHRDVPREVLGVPAHTIEPGGFALVVDRFRNQAHRDAEGLMWENWGRLIGAASTFLYVGELEIVGWLDNA